MTSKAPTGKNNLQLYKRMLALLSTALKTTIEKAESLQFSSKMLRVRSPSLLPSSRLTLS